MSLRTSPLQTAAQQAAQRSNARRSTGPRTEQGKSRSRWNALRHGGWASGLAWSKEALQALGEDPAEFERLRQYLLSAPGPADDPLWELQVEDLARLYWRRQRLERAWEAWGARQVEWNRALVSTTLEGELLLRQLDRLDRAIDRQTRLLLRMRQAGERQKSRLEEEKRRRVREKVREKLTGRASGPPRHGGELAEAEAEVELEEAEAEAARLEAETRRLQAEIVALLDASELEERSRNVAENKDPEAKEVTSAE